MIKFPVSFCSKHHPFLLQILQTLTIQGSSSGGGTGDGGGSSGVSRATVKERFNCALVIFSKGLFGIYFVFQISSNEMLPQGAQKLSFFMLNILLSSG